MTDPPIVPTREELLTQLRTSADESIARLHALPLEQFELGRYENGWNGREILAHMASIEWTYPRLLEIPVTSPSAAEGSPPSRPAEGGIDAYNARQVAKREGLPVADLLAEFEQNRAIFITAVESASPELFEKPITSAGGRTGPLARVIHEVAVLHILGHTNDIVGHSA